MDVKKKPAKALDFAGRESQREGVHDDTSSTTAILTSQDKQMNRRVFIND